MVSFETLGLSRVGAGWLGIGNMTMSGVWFVREGRAIARYLAEQNKLDSIYPSDPKKRALCDLALDFHLGTFAKEITVRKLKV